MSYEIAIINPRKRKSRKTASKTQLAARRKFIARFARSRKARRKARKAKSHNSGVSVMTKRRKRRSSARNAKGHFVKRRRKSRVAKAVVKRRRRRAGKRSPAMGYTIGPRRIRRRKLNPRGRRRRHNPRFLPSFSGVMDQLMNASLGAAGGLGLNLALSYIPLPDALKTGWPRHGVRVVGALALGMLAKHFLGSKGNAVAAGALTIAVYDIGKQVINGVSPEIGARLGEFEDVSLSGDDFDYIDPATPIEGMGSFLTGPDANGSVDEQPMGNYLQGNLDGNLDGRYEDLMV